MHRDCAPARLCCSYFMILRLKLYFIYMQKIKSEYKKSNQMSHQLPPPVELPMQHILVITGRNLARN